jgi:hypothetical protein
MITQTYIVRFLIVVLCLSSLTDCSGGGNGNGNNETLATSTATVTGLDPNTPYYFAVSAYNGLSGPCSNEVFTVTPLSGVVGLAWDSIRASAVLAYDVHYGKQPSRGPGDCTYPDSMRVLVPSRS